MIEIQQFESKLKEFTNSETIVRPFLCNGFPFDNEIFLVGINPATKINFWDFWSNENGCNKEGWLNEYRKQNGKIGPTRKRIEIFLNQAKKLKILETNIYPFYSPRFKDLKQEHKNPELFKYLIDTIKPKLIIGFGNPVIKFLSNHYSTNTQKNIYHKVNSVNWDLEIRYENHFSYQWSDSGIKKLSKEIENKYSK
jgi:hypothetical protein